MVHPTKAIALGLVGMLPATLFGFSDVNSTLSRAVTPQVAVTNASIQVTATFFNLSTDVLNGFCYMEEVPSALEVTTLGVKVNGQAVTNFLFETGLDGDVYAGCTPRCWVLETPTNFAQGTPVPPQGIVQITYALSSSATGTRALQQFSWAAGTARTTNSFFGHGEAGDLQWVKFVSGTNNHLLNAQLLTNGFTVWVDGVPGSIYYLAASTNFSSWIPLATNRSPFVFTDTNSAAFSRRFYRALPYAIPWAPLALARGQTNSLLLSVYGVTECSYVLESSTNLVSWSPVLTNACPFNYVEPDVRLAPVRFYRARLLSSP